MTSGVTTRTPRPGYDPESYAPVAPDRLSEITEDKGTYIPYDPGQKVEPTNPRERTTALEEPDGDSTSEPALEHIKPVEELEFCDDEPETVCEEDERKEIKDCVEPYRKLCLLLITFRTAGGGKARGRGTGFLAGPRLVLTAGHCVFSHNRLINGWAEQIEVIPWALGSTKPFGSKVVRSTKLRALKGWIDDSDQGKDIGAIFLPDEGFSQLGHFGLRALNDSQAVREMINIYGYPGDKPAGTLWGVGGKVVRTDPCRLFYLNDTYAGQSGSPVWTMGKDSKERYVVAVHAYGGCPNKGCRITPDAGRTIQAWERESRQEVLKKKFF
jgi:V8-like Glu-specific endopeptidase